MWSEKISSKAIAEEQSFLHQALKIGIFGCAFSFCMNIVSNLIYYWFLSILFSGGAYDYYGLYVTILSITNPLSIFASILTTIGFYALLRSNMSRLALPYVFVSLIPNAIISNVLRPSLGILSIDVYNSLISVIIITSSLIFAWILWTINDTVSDRELLRNIVLLLLLRLAYDYLISGLLSTIFPVTTLFDVILYHLPSILLSLIWLLMVVRLFRQDQVIVIEDEVSQTASSEWQ